jgi:FAD/FMN-containing dehydrogenase
MTADGHVLLCSPRENADAFWATIGGMGLTGCILTARMRLSPVQSAYLTVDYQRTRNLDQALELFGEGDIRYQYSVAWIDCHAGGSSLGRSVLIRGNFAPAAELPAALAAAPLSVRRRRKRSVPFFMPGMVLNPLSVRLFNGAFYSRHKDQRRIVDYDTFFYPLDSTLKWNRMYGKRGFVQYQAVFPPQNSRAGLVELLEKLSASRRASFLAVLKTFGPQGPGLLSFPMAGQTLALDLPNTGPDLVAMLGELDQIVLKHGGRVYLAKDACLGRDAFHAMYPRLDEFRRIKQRLDPRGRFNSSLARRLGMTEGS